MIMLTSIVCLLSITLAVISIITLTDIISDELEPYRRNQVHVAVMQIFVSAIFIGATVILLTGIPIRPSPAPVDDTQKSITDCKQENKS